MKMDERERPTYEPPVVEDLGTLEEITGSGAPTLIPQEGLDMKSG
jgi:hypothetical protein